MAAEAKTTTDRKEIQKWVESRKGQPATVADTGGKSDAGVLRIDFPGYRGRGRLEPISWDQFFEKFEEKKLAFLYQDKTAQGRESRFFKLVKREPRRRKAA